MSTSTSRRTRAWVAVLAVSAVLATPADASATDPGGPQQLGGFVGDLPGGSVNLPTGSEIVQRLKDEALGAVTGCDYQRYLDLAEQGLSAWNMFRNYGADDQPRNRTAVPFMDVLGDVFRAAGAAASQTSAKSEAHTLVYNLEQVCNAVVQADEINRTYEIFQAGRINVGNALGWLTDATDFNVAITPSTGVVQINADWNRLYSGLVPARRTGNDSLYAQLDHALHQHLVAVSDMPATFEHLHRTMEEQRRALLEYAYQDPQDNHRWKCPEEYAVADSMVARLPTERDPTDGDRSKPVCGPASPERSTRITATTRLIQSEVQALGLSLESRMLEIEATRLMLETHERKATAAVRTMSIGRGM